MLFLPQAPLGRSLTPRNPLRRAHVSSFRKRALCGYSAGAEEDQLDRAEDDWGPLLAAGQAGDADAYRRFLTAITPFLRSLAHRRVGNDPIAEDIVQDVLLTVHRIRHTYEPGRPVQPWLAAITQRRTVDGLRRRARLSGQEVHDEHAVATFADPEAKGEESGDAAVMVARASATLSPGQKEAIELVKLKEMSLAEASAASGQSISLLKVNIHRAIKKMRAALKDGNA